MLTWLLWTFLFGTDFFCLVSVDCRLAGGMWTAPGDLCAIAIKSVDGRRYAHAPTLVNATLAHMHTPLLVHKHSRSTLCKHSRSTLWTVGSLWLHHATRFICSHLQCVCGRYLLASFHGDTNGLATIPVIKALHEACVNSFPDHIAVFGLDANTVSWPLIVYVYTSVCFA
jgi:hypothetical protein